MAGVASSVGVLPRSIATANNGPVGAWVRPTRGRDRNAHPHGFAYLIKEGFIAVGVDGCGSSGGLRPCGAKIIPS